MGQELDETKQERRSRRFVELWSEYDRCKALGVDTKAIQCEIIRLSREEDDDDPDLRALRDSITPEDH